MQARLAFLPVAALAACAIAGCGGGGHGSDPATLAPPKSPLYVEATLRPEGEEKANVDSLAKSVGGIDDLGGFIVSKLESAAGDAGAGLDFETEVEPWLGEKAGLSFRSYDGNDFHGYGVAVQTSDPGEAQAFVDRQSAKSDETFEDGSYEGVDYKVQEDGTTVGVIGEFLAIAEDAPAFRTMVDASEGESLAGEDDFASAIAAAPSDSFADLFVDVGGLIEQSGGTIDPEAKQFLDTIGIDPSAATAVASLVPGSDRLEIDLSSDLGGENPPTGDASKLLGSLPGDSVAALASADFGKRFGEAIDRIDADGIPGQVPPHELKKTMRAAGIDLEKISSSVGDLGVFAEGSSAGSLGGAVVLEDQSAGEARDAVSNVGLLLRASGTAGVTAIGGKFSGFSVRGPQLGHRPLIVAAAGQRIAIAYGLPAATKALVAEGGGALAESSTYREAVSALGGTPISGFVDGPAALRLASALVPPGEAGFREAKPYLGKVDYVAIGAGASGDRSTAKLIVGVGK